VRAVAKMVVMNGRIGARNELRDVDVVNTAAMSDMVPEKRPRTSLSPQRGQPTLLCMSAYLPSLRFPHLPSHPMFPNQTSTPLRPPAHTSCHQRCALCIETVIWSSLDLCRLPPRPPDYTHISTTTLYVSCRRRPHDLHLYRRYSRVGLFKRLSTI
jgi:hypothetical protein